MSSSADVPIEVLKQISNLLRRLTSEEIDALVTGQARLVCESLPRKGYTKRSSPSDLPNPVEVRAALSAMDSREKGYAYLEELGLNREKLRTLASALDLPTFRSDTVDKTKDRIIEATIGYRIRSEAIRGIGPEAID
ncbi:hypothetical protein OG352_20815 [Streptomyces sp. NBC_01485]|uniref:hypothetical protein n=1 Tax=Streptomyces sp. NBC_01485 TaxID=2903884 RepID=UPI002E3494F7|nr:hypothetical protein [Streptomyces sp. NBC_01485]